MVSDLRYALRALRHHRSFALVGVLSIALGIGANSVVFSLADALLFRPLPVPKPAKSRQSAIPASRAAACSNVIPGFRRFPQ